MSDDRPTPALDDESSFEERGVIQPARPPSSTGQAPMGSESRASDSGTPSAVELDESVTETIRRWGGVTTPHDLEKRGVRRLRTIPMSHIASLIEKAVNRALLARQLDDHTDEALAMSESARVEFLRLAKNEMDARRAQEAAERRASTTLDRLRQELADSKHELAVRENELDHRTDDSAADDRLEERLRELFAIHSKDPDRALESKAIAVALDEVQSARRHARETQAAESRREIDRLERRIEKLSVLLDETEDQLRLVRSRKTVDPGIASIYDAVQGLDQQDNDFEQKADLMRCIFEANLALRS